MLMTEFNNTIYCKAAPHKFHVVGMAAKKSIY